MQKAGYTIKQGKYIAMKPKHGNQFIRLKSLGEFYSEYGLKNWLRAKQQFEEKIDQQIKAAQQNEPAVIVLRTIQFYTISFGKDALPVRKRYQQKPFSWTNDAELDKLLRLNKQINDSMKPSYNLGTARRLPAAVRREKLQNKCWMNTSGAFRSGIQIFIFSMQ